MAEVYGLNKKAKSWILECLTEGVDGDVAWRHLIALVALAQTYKQVNGEFPGMVIEKGHGLLKIREDELAKYLKDCRP
jgi:hypothetical protein